MKSRPEQTKKQRDQEIRFIRRGPIKLRKHKKLINGKVTKEDLVMLISSLWHNLGKITIFRKESEKLLYREREVRKYKNFPAFGRLNKYPKKILVGIYGTWLQTARKEGLFN